MAERLGLERDLAMVEMTGAKYHADQLSTALALPALERAQTTRAGRDGRGQHSPPDSQRAGRRRLSQLFQSQNRRCAPRRIGWRLISATGKRVD